MHQATLQGHQRLVWQSILWDKIGLGLQCKHPQHFDAGIHQETLAEIQALYAKSTPTLSILTVPQAVRCTGSNSRPRGHFPETFSRGNQGNPMHCWQHTVLCLCCWHNCPHGIELNCYRADKGDDKYNATSKATFRLPCHQPRRNHTVPCLRHDYECAFGRILPFQIWHVKLRLLTFFMGWTAKDGDPIKLNRAFFTLCAILRFVVASATEAKIGALFLNCKEGMIFLLILEELGHPQPKTQVHCNNATAVGIANNIVKRQHLQSMEMRYFWVCDKITQSAYNVKC